MPQTPVIVIVTHNSAGHLAACLESVARFGLPAIVVDNASSDGSAEMARRYKGVQVIANPENRGFAGACNQGIRATGGGLFLLLNPDARLLTPLTPLIDACADPRTGAAAGQLTGDDGSPQSGFTLRRFPTCSTLVFETLGINRLWPSNPINRRYRCLDANLGVSQYAEQPAGACLLVRRDVWALLGGFDERFHPLWFEDVDFLKRLTAAGFEVRYDPAAKAAHSGGHSIEGLPPARRRLYWYASLLTYAAKHFSRPSVRVVAMAIMAGVGARWIGEMIGGAGSSRYTEVIRLAWRAFLNPDHMLRNGKGTA
jgi:hypothetical protein